MLVGNSINVSGLDREKIVGRQVCRQVVKQNYKKKYENNFILYKNQNWESGSIGRDDRSAQVISEKQWQ